MNDTDGADQFDGADMTGGREVELQPDTRVKRGTPARALEPCLPHINQRQRASTLWASCGPSPHHACGSEVL
jgi:hypothetical protein